MSATVWVATSVAGAAALLLMVMFCELRRAPQGWQDERGFHEGEEE